MPKLPSPSLSGNHPHAGELQQQEDESEELAGRADATGEDTVEPIRRIADEAGEHHRRDFDPDEPFRTESQHEERRDLLDLGQLPAMVEAHPERWSVRLAGEGEKLDGEFGVAGRRTARGSDSSERTQSSGASCSPSTVAV